MPLSKDYHWGFVSGLMSAICCANGVIDTTGELSLEAFEREVNKFIEFYEAEHGLVPKKEEVTR